MTNFNHFNQIWPKYGLVLKLKTSKTKGLILLSLRSFVDLPPQKS